MLVSVTSIDKEKRRCNFKHRLWVCDSSNSYIDMCPNAIIDWTMHLAFAVEFCRVLVVNGYLYFGTSHDQLTILSCLA